MSWGTRTGITRTANIDVQDVRLVRWTSDFTSIEFPEGASQSFKAGQPVKLSSGLLIACTDADTAVLGIAVKDASGVTNFPMPVWVMNEDIVFLAKCSGGSVAVANIGAPFQVDLTAGLYTVDLASAANPFFKIVGVPVGFATTGHENNNKAYVIGINAARQMN